MLNVLIVAMLVAQAGAQYTVGDEIDFDVTITSSVDWSKPLQFRDLDLMCDAPKRLPADHIHCRIVNMRTPT